MGFLRELCKRNSVKLLIVTVAVLFTLRFLLPFFAPFVIAVIFVLIFHPLFRRIQKKTRVPKGLLAGFTLLLLFLLLAVILGCVAYKCIDVIGFCNENAAQWKESCCGLLTDCCKMAEDGIGINAKEMERGILKQVNQGWEGISENLIPKLLNFSYSFKGVLAGIAICIIFSVIASILLTKDYEEIRARIQNSQCWSRVKDIGHKLAKVLGVYLRAQAIIMALILTIGIVGLWAFGIENAIWLGILMGVLDVLPFIGTGMVLVPLFVWMFLEGNLLAAFGCLLLYGICAFIRQMLEPRLVGNRINIYPVFLLLSVYVGIRFYGAFGILLGPLSLFLIKEIYSEIKTSSKVII